MSDPRRPALMTSPRPLFSLLALFGFLVAVVVVISTGNADAPMFFPLVATSVPSLVAAIASETAVRDIRNGTVVEKAREGASQALVDHQVVTRDGPVVTTQLAALQRLLEGVQVTAASTEAKVDQAASLLVEAAAGDVSDTPA